MPGSTVPPDTGMYTPVRQTQQAGLVVRVGSKLTLESHRITHRLCPAPEGVRIPKLAAVGIVHRRVQRGVARVAAGLPLHQAALRVILEHVIWPARCRRVTGVQAVG